MARSWSQTEGRAKGRLGEATRPRIGGGLSSGFRLLAEMNGGSISGPRAGREVKARRREVRLPGKEEDKKVLSSISTSFPRRWKSRPAQRITGVLSPPHRFANKEVILDLTIDHSFPTEPPLFAIRSTYLCLPFFITYQPFQSLRKNQDC